MKCILAAAGLLLALSGCADLHHATPVAASPAAPREVRMAFDVTSGNPQVVNLTLATIEMTRKQLVEAGFTPHIVVAFRGDASYFTQDSIGVVKEADRADALAVKGKIKALKASQVVDSFEQCNVPLASRKLKGNELMQEVKLVPNGWIALADYQRRGYAYIVP